MPVKEIIHFKTNISEYLEGLPKITQDRLYRESATCLAIFRLLPSLAKHFVNALLYVEDPFLKKDLQQWIKPEGASKLEESWEKLSRLHILAEKEGYIIMNKTFRENYRNCLTGGGEHQSFGVPPSSNDKHRPENIIEFLDDYAKKQWESILHYMVGTRTKRPGRGVVNLLTESGLMAERHDGDEDPQITNRGFQFLLQDINTQVWAFLLQYLELAGILKMDLVEVLNFYFLLGSLELGQDYSIDQLTPTQQQLIEDLAYYGLVYRRKKSSRRYYPTRLATTLTSGTNMTFTKQHSISIINPLAVKDTPTEQGFIVLETNYKLYAYTNSQLQISVLNLFCELTGRYSNMVTGMLTRDSARKALMSGITANQIISYLASHAHPQMKQKSPVLPLTVIDQIRLWEMERNRLQDTDAFLYTEFKSDRDFNSILEHAYKLGIIIWANPTRRVFAVTEDGHPQIREFIKKRMKKNGPQASGSSSKIIGLAFVLAVGFLLAILSCALNNKWWPLFVVATFVIAPLPNWIFGGCSNGDDFYSENSSSLKDFGQFLTGILIVTGFALPFTLAHAGITYAAMAMSIGGGILVYSTRQQCKSNNKGRQCVWICADYTDCPNTGGTCSNGVCLYDSDQTLNITSTSSTPTRTPAVVSDKSFEKIFLTMLILVVVGAGIFGIWWYRRRRIRIHRFQTLVSNTPRNSIISTSNTLTRGMEERGDFLDVRGISPREIPHDNRSSSNDDVVHQAAALTVGSGDNITYGAGVGGTSGGVAGGGDFEANTEIEEPLNETTIYGDTGASTSSIDLSAEGIHPHHGEPYPDDE
ncbi:522_t:CDS:10 [Ambispora gerdemannii]|uniref:RNA polymerase II transcription factor B subunit 2 n=1 Tax=Ambispora gerdemannii TaxID=144530 RepID=A0A9N8V015_9GLOM|nr:522_t:CDS:10 [Ambispora gerdemannii]